MGFSNINHKLLSVIFLETKLNNLSVSLKKAKYYSAFLELI
jgi:hypothetical protein